MYKQSGISDINHLAGTNLHQFNITSLSSIIYDDNLVINLRLLRGALTTQLLAFKAKSMIQMLALPKL